MMVTVVPGVNFDRLGCRVGQEHLEGGQRRDPPASTVSLTSEGAGKDQRGGEDRCSDHSDRVRRDCGKVTVAHNRCCRRRPVARRSQITVS